MNKIYGTLVYLQYSTICMKDIADFIQPQFIWGEILHQKCIYLPNTLPWKVDSAIQYGMYQLVVQYSNTHRPDVSIKNRSLLKRTIKLESDWTFTGNRWWKKELFSIFAILCENNTYFFSLLKWEISINFPPLWAELLFLQKKPFLSLKRADPLI